jgi:Transcriptional regulator
MPFTRFCYDGGVNEQEVESSMYQPPAFREDRIEVQHALIRKHPLGLLITAGPAGLLANLFPFLIDAAGAEKGTLRLHIARANPQWRELEAVEECLAVFQGRRIM